MPVRYEPKDLELIFRDLEGANARATISVAGSLLEYALEQSIKASLRTAGTSAEKDALSKEHGILGTFSEKIWAAYFMRVIGPRTRHDIDIVRAMRNYVSHNMNPVDFDTEEIRGWCSSLYLAQETIGAKETPPDIKAMFLGTTHLLTGALLAQAAAPNVGYDVWVALQEMVRLVGE